MDRKNKGFMFPVVLLIIVFLVVIVNSVNTLSLSHSTGIIHDESRSKAYYIAYSGLQMVYSSLNDEANTGNKGSIIGLSKTEQGRRAIGANGDGKKAIVMMDADSNKNIEIKGTDGSTLGYVDLYAILEIKSGTKNSWVWKIQSTGKLKKDSKSPYDTHTLTMTVETNSPGAPQISEGKIN